MPNTPSRDVRADGPIDRNGVEHDGDVGTRRDHEVIAHPHGIIPTSMMDVSDGLSSEILHICKQSNLGCLIFEDKIPVNDEARQFAYKLELDPTACALSGGEDYELLFTIKQADYDKLVLNEQISVIGYMTEPDKGSRIQTRGGSVYPLTAQGWNAFNP